LTAFVVPSILFVLFALFSAAGAYFLAAQTRGRKAGIVAALLTLVFFALLFAALLFVMPKEGLPGG
jgi:NADH:ubiquinone oxidoreductase subunit 3 (subunit A)